MFETIVKKRGMAVNKTDRIKELVDTLNKASKAYYQDENEIMTNFEYDGLYDELVKLEEETGMVLANSPTVNVGYQVVSELPKEQHERPMLSLDKTKDVAALVDFSGNRKSLLSWKLDGLTVVLTYANGSLIKAVTRGNGQIGEVITNNAKTFKNIPLTIPYKGNLTLRGEAIIKYSDFEQINKEIEDSESKYKNPRNLCSGSVRQLNSEITAKRNVNFIAFALISADNVDFENSIEKQFEWLDGQGFEVVERKVVTDSNMEEMVHYFAEKIKTYDYPSDGLVLMYDDIAYGLSLGTTAKFPRNGIAFKWEDEQAKTVLKYIEWSPSRTGLINPVAVFEPVELEGTTVSRASVHNISIMEELSLGEGDEIKVFHIQFAMEQILIISQNHAVLCRTDFGNVNRLASCNTKPLSLTYRVANNSFMMPKHISVFICKIACRIVFSCKPADKSSIIPIWDKTDILAVRLICVIEILLVCDHAGLMFIHVSKGKHGMCQLLLGKGIKDIALVFCRVSCFFQKIPVYRIRNLWLRLLT